MALSVPSCYNSHYLQAYSQVSPSAPSLNNASTSLVSNNGLAPAPSKTSFLDSKSFWYQSGNHRCNQQGCAFFGSQKSVEIHMMDRHLIYPPGWEKRKKADWDADPSLKGCVIFILFYFSLHLYIYMLYRKPIPIQGTNIILNSPEILDAWIAERKKRFPTSSRVEDKKRKLEDAVARGQLNITTTLRSNKRQKYDHRRNDHDGSHQRMQSRAGKNDKSQTRTTDAGWGSRVRAAPAAPSSVVAATAIIEASPSSPSSEDDTDCEPEVLSSKILRASEIPVVQDSKPLAPSRSVIKNDVVDRHRNSALQPKNPPTNPFASRPTLLRNVSLSFCLANFAIPDSFAF